MICSDQIFHARPFSRTLRGDIGCRKCQTNPRSDVHTVPEISGERHLTTAARMICRVELVYRAEMVEKASVGEMEAGIGRIGLLCRIHWPGLLGEADCG